MKEDISPAQERKAFTQPAERKSASRGEMSRAFGEFFRAFEAFKSANDERLSALEKKRPDPLTDQKVERINSSVGEIKSRLDRLASQMSRPPLGAGFDEASVARKAFREFLRRGTVSPALIGDTKSLSGASGAEGGYLMPAEVEQMIDRVLPRISPIRSLATVRQIGGTSLKKPFAITGAETGWVAETASRPETDAPTLAEVEYLTSELYAMPAASTTLLDDSAADVEVWLAEEIQTVFAEQEGTAFVTGNGTNKPKGFLAYTTVADASWAWDKIGYIASGAAGAFAASNPSDALINLIYAPRQSYRSNANWVMNRSSEAAVRKFKDADGNYLWRPGSEVGQPASLMGYPVIESEDMPNIAADAYAIAFGDFRRGYLIVDRVGIRILRDPYSAKPYVLFYATKRVGGGVQDFAAIKLMKFAAS